MKILRIAGKNLASLGGEFSLDFTQEPLFSAGLFAICGPTGAGKSTLLDALCLALYDATPRLSRAGSKGIGLPDVRDETVTPQDTRNLLQRGSADGYAEVDFIGNDSQCYRARWSVRRARAKADGALQQVSMSLAGLPDRQAIGGTNREVKAEIEKRIGLNFDQFTRAVLLAQNEFSAFLRADDGERGELLETLTGTAIYSDMSRRAFERAKAEQQSLNTINQRLADQSPLDAQARLELERDCAQVHDSMMILERRKDELEAQLRWHAMLLEAQRGEQDARREADRLSSTYEGMGERRRRLALVEQVQPARAMLDECARIASTIDSIKSELNDIGMQLDVARKCRQDAQHAMSAAEQAHSVALKARETALPDIDKAKVLDAQIAALIPDNEHSAANVAQIRADRSDIETRRHAGRNALQAVDEARRAAERWLTENALVQSLALQWPRWDSLLKHAAVQLQASNASAQDLATGKEASRKATGKLGESEALLASAAQTHAEAETQRLTCQFESASHSRTALRQERQELESRRDILEDGARRWSVLRSAEQHQQQLRNEAEQLRIAESEATLMSRRLENDVAIAKSALDQAEKSQITARIACSDSVEHLRDALEDDLPCPVCGSVEHPYTGNSVRLHSMLAQFDAEAAACRVRYEDTLARHASQQALLQDSRRRLVQVSLQIQDADGHVLAAKAEWMRHHVVPMANARGSDDIERWLTDAIFAIRQRLQQVFIAETEADNAAQRLETAQRAFDAAAASLAARREQFDLLMNEARQLKSEVERMMARTAETDARLAEILEELAPAFSSPDWSGRWRRDPEAFRKDCENRIADWHTQCRIRDENGARLADLENSFLKLQDAMIRCNAELQRASLALEESSRRIAERRTARAEIFGGKSASIVEEELATAVSLAKAAMHEQSMHVQECAITVARHQETIDQTKQRLAALEIEHAVANARVENWITQFAAANTDPSTVLDSESLRALLTCSLESIAVERSELNAAFTAMQTANAILRERKERCAAHEQGRIGTEDADTAGRLLEELMNRFEAVRTDFTRKKFALAEDDSRREKSSALLADLEQQQRNARLWGQLAELIGSADGKKFRNYAQQFTLDVLLGYANRHLQDLARRYRIERVKETLALLVVDQDMGDEVRSIHSLSGGESFLVSLALALGLASLSSNRVRVQSLFIDEGFGSLDAETLSIAMHALDSLQSQGRKVGVITHVQDMSERIGTKVMVHRVAGGKSLVRIESESVR